MPPTVGAGTLPEQIECFEGKVRPLLADHCCACQSERIEAPFGSLLLDSRESGIKCGDSGPALVSGKPGQSKVVAMLRGEPVLMPPTGQLTDKQIAVVATWIRIGVPWPDPPGAGPSSSESFGAHTHDTREQTGAGSSGAA